MIERGARRIATLLLEGREWGSSRRRRSAGRRSSSGGCTPSTTTSSCRSTASTRRATRAAVGRWRRCSNASSTRTPSGRRWVRSPRRASGGRRPPSARRPRRRAQPAAAEALDGAAGDVRGDRLHLVMAVFADKDLEGIVRPLAPLADAGYATAVDSVRARPAFEVADAGRRRYAVRDVRHRRGGARIRAEGRVRERPHPGDGLSVHCRGRPPGVGGEPRG